MKNLFVLFVFVFTCSFAFAQKVEVTESQRAVGNGTHNAFMFDLSDIDKDMAKKDWEKFMDNFKGKTKYDRKTKVYTTENAKLPQLSTSTVKVYSQIDQEKGMDKQTSMIVWFDLGDSGYASTELDSAKGAYAHELLKEFSMIVYKHRAEEIVKEQEKMLSNLEKDLDKLKKDKDGYHKDIEKAKEEIAKNEKNIEINVLDQENKVKEIESQREAVEKAKQHVKKFIL